MARQRILVVEDDDSIRRGLVDSLEFAGYSVLECDRGDDARRLLVGPELDLVLLDVLLPGADGFELLSELRRSRPRLPVIMVTARGAEEDRVRGLKDGADDYVVKPFSSTELLARVEAVLRRSAERPVDVRFLALGPVQVSLERREVVREPVESGESGESGDAAASAESAEDAAERAQLSEREADILRYLAAANGRAVAREELLQRVWGLDPRGLETRTVDMHVARLREKLRDPSAESRFVVTVRGKGYMLGADVEVSA